MPDRDPNKRIIVISPTPSHPQNAGNRNRIHRFLSELQDNGFEIHFVYTGMECNARHVSNLPDYAGMQKCWDHFVYIPQAEAYIVSLASPLLILLSNIARHINSDQGLFIFFRGYRILAKTMAIFSRPGVYQLLDYYYALRLRCLPASKKSSPKYQSLSSSRSYIQKRLKAIQSNSAPEHFDIDDWYTKGIDSALTRLQKRYNYPSVLVEYVFMSAALLNFPDTTLKVIDTHDIFTNRKAGYVKAGIEERFFTTSVVQERIGLRRADKIIAIQHNEAIVLNQIADMVPIATIGHIVQQSKAQTRKPDSFKVLYLGSGNPSNIHGMQWFLNQVYPLLITAIPQVKIVIAGLICNALPDLANCEKTGEVNAQQLQDLYLDCDIAINPGSTGTGLKIKNVEALGFSKPLITTSESAQGLEDFAGSYIIADSAEDFAVAISRMLQDTDYYNSFVQHVYNQVAAYNANIKHKIRLLFDA